LENYWKIKKVFRKINQGAAADIQLRAAAYYGGRFISAAAPVLSWVFV
jgi:hypothetical protein